MKHFVGLLGAFFLLSPVVLAQEPDWNHFRGPNRDNHSFSKGIAKSWPDGGPKLLWKINTLGNGFSNLCFSGDTIYTMGDFNNRCFVLALNRANGEIKWRQEIGGAGRIANQQSPHCTPACDGDGVYAMAPDGNFVALDAKTGEIRWRKNVRTEFGGSFMGQWGFAMSPIIDDGKIVVPVGGDGGVVVAFNKAGNVVWRTTDLPDSAGYTSIVPVEIGGVRQYLSLSNNYLVGLSPTDGKILWGGNFPARSAVASDPVLCGDVIMAACSYNVGGYFYRITKEGDTFKAFDFHGDDQNLQSHHGGIVAVGDHFYLLTNTQMVCVEAKTAKIVWENRSVGKGSLTYVDGVLILRSERGDGTIAMIEATPEGYKELGRFDQPERSNLSSWTYPVVVDKKLYIRDQGLLLVYDLN
ncbi:MAG: PQQ-binding-like beta-propeller repeat protein [Planctomycetaceae bacterium]|nr:PQQ-binding-like beta-propeller repeat protein [Planctomycetaceae bacterium]